MQVTTASGRRLSLRGPGRAGGEGTVYAVEGDASVVAKIYHPNRATAEVHDKVRAMAARPPADPALRAGTHRSIAWVIEPLSDDGGRFAGFTMPALDRAVFAESHTFYDPADRLARVGAGFTWRHLLTAAANLASSVAAVHAQGHRVGDLRETNVLVSPTALVALIDCDSFQVDGGSRTFYPRVGSGEYLPPELHGVDFSGDHDRTHADAFALGVLIFRFLMQGVHPFQARGWRVDGSTTIEDKIRRGNFPYVRRRGIAPPDFAPPFTVLPPAVRALFVRCFRDGHRRPAKRPSPQEWFDVLAEEAARARTCVADPTHAYGAHLRRCPWCAAGTQTPVAVVTPAPPPSPVTASTPQGMRVRVSTLLALGRVAWRWARRVRRLRRSLSRPSPRTARRALAGVGALVFLILLMSPVGRSAAAPSVTVAEWGASATGPCPHAGVPLEGCRARWRFLSVERTEQRTRNLFVLRQRSSAATVRFRVRFDGPGRCAVPWVEHLTFNAAGAGVCLGPCPPRIELRARDGGAAALSATGGVAARGGTLPCGRWHGGSWTFDTTGARGPLTVRYPGLRPLRSP